MALTLRFLGPPQLLLDQHPLPLPRTRKALLLLVLLTLHANRSVDRKFLAETLWPECDPTVGATNLRQALAILRRTLAGESERLVPEGNLALRLHLSEAECDVLALDAALRRGDSLRAQALATGPFLEGFTEDWVLREREKRAQALVSLLPPPSAHLPAFLTPFLGRATECERLRGLLLREGIRLVSVLGMGGLGKTRLSVAVASTLPHAHFVDLAPLPVASAPQTLWQALAESLSLSSLTEAAVLDALWSAPRLLILDNAEPVIESAARVVEALLRRVPGCKVLVTSREPLRLPGEVLFRLLPLREAEALALFQQRAELVQPGVALDPLALERLCARLEGLPLAIELAAARLSCLSLSELETYLQDRFRLLRSEQRRPHRHQTLRTLLDGSWEPLMPEERRVLGALSLLVGSWDRTLAQAVAFPPGTDPLSVAERLGRLVETSWIQASREQFSLLETVREYLLPHQHPEDRERLIAFAQQVIPWQRASETESAWLQRLAHYRDNLRIALSLAAPEQLAPLAIHLGDAFVIQGRYTEGLALLTAALAQTTQTHPLRAALLYHTALLEQALDNPARAESLLEQGLACSRREGNASLQIRILGNLGLNARNQRDHPRARAYYLEALALHEATGLGAPETLYIRLGVSAHDQGELGEARDYFQRAMDCCRAAGSEIGLAIAQTKCGYVERDAGRLEEAERLWRAALAAHRQTGYVQEQGNVALALSRVVASPEEAMALRAEAHDAFTTLQDVEGLERLQGILSGGG